MTQNELQLLIKEGEGLTVEFKEKFSPKIDRDIVAMANARGGHIMLGVDDNGKIIGETLTNKRKAEIIDIARKCDPAIEVKIKQIDKVLIIEEAHEKPYSCSSGYFRRLDAVTQKMTQKEVSLLFKNANAISFEEHINKMLTGMIFLRKRLEIFLKRRRLQSTKLTSRMCL